MLNPQIAIMFRIIIEKTRGPGVMVGVHVSMDTRMPLCRSVCHPAMMGHTTSEDDAEALGNRYGGGWSANVKILLVFEWNDE